MLDQNEVRLGLSYRRNVRSLCSSLEWKTKKGVYKCTIRKRSLNQFPTEEFQRERWHRFYRGVGRKEMGKQKS